MHFAGATLAFQNFTQFHTFEFTYKETMEIQAMQLRAFYIRALREGPKKDHDTALVSRGWKLLPKLQLHKQHNLFTCDVNPM